MAGDRPTDGFVLIDGPQPTEAEHIFDHFFSGFRSQGYSPDHVRHVKERRTRHDLQGILFFDELLALASEQNVDQAQSIYPPSAGKEGMLHLIEVISSSSFDRLRRMALLYYVLLDLCMFDNSEAVALAPFVEASGLPRSMRHAMAGYWHLDVGKYRTGVSYLQQPDFIPRIAKLLNPIAYATQSEEEAEDRSLAFLAFLKLCPDESKLMLSNTELTEARIVATCHASGIRPAWLWSCQVMTPEGNADEEQLMMRCVARIIEFCFMPRPKPQAVQALLSLPLSPPEEALLAHVVVNPPPSVSYSSTAHAVAIDTLIVRQINSGHYIDAVLLDRRVNDSLGLMHLSGDRSMGADRERLRQLRSKRQALVKAATAVLTRVERTLLELGDEIDIQDSVALEEEVAEDEARSDASWERIPSAADQSARFVNETEPMTTSLTASPALRSQKTATNQAGDPLLTALARSKLVQLTASPKRFSAAAIGDATSRSFAYSTSVKPAVAEPSVMAQDSPVVRAMAAQEPENVSFSSPLATRRPYRLESTALDSRGSPALVQQGRDAAGEPSMEEASGPMAKLAQQLEQEMLRNQSTMTDILRRSVSTGTSPFRVTGAVPKNAHSTLALGREPKRYEARYEIGGRSEDRTRGDTRMDEADGVAEESPAKEVPKRRQARRAPPKAARPRKATPGGAGSLAESQDQRTGAVHEADTSVPGSFPGMDMSDEEDQAVESGRQRAKGRGKAAAPATAERPARRGKARQADEQAESEAHDVVPELLQTPSKVRRSRSAASGLVTRPTASTPLRRSSRLSVEPESNQERNEDVDKEPATAKRTSRSASPTKGNKKAAAGSTKKERQANVEETGEPTPVLTRSSSRRKAAG